MTNTNSENKELLKAKLTESLLPFILKDVAGIPEYNQADGIHPNPKGHEKVAESVTTFVEKNL